jgi:ATP-binding cassette subfamily C (CFTR/MRP) protein 1
MPLMFLPIVIAVIVDALVSLRRISKFLTAEELAEPYTLDYESKNAIAIDGDLTWETAGKATSHGSKSTPEKGGEPTQKSGVQVSENAGKAKWRSFFEGKNGGDGAILPTTSAEVNLQEPSGEKDAVQTEEEKPFELKNLNVHIAKGQSVAIVGRFACGKVTITQICSEIYFTDVRCVEFGIASAHEMRRTRGSVSVAVSLSLSFSHYEQVVFGGNVAYVPQTAWIKNATLRENVTFGQPDDEDRHVHLFVVFDILA